MVAEHLAQSLAGTKLGLTGIAVLGFYRAHSPELAAGQTLHSMGDRLFPMFIMAQMPAGLSGLVLAAILSAALSIAYAKDLGLPLTISFVWIIPCSLLVGITVGVVASGIAGRARLESRQ